MKVNITKGPVPLALGLGALAAVAAMRAWRERRYRLEGKVILVTGGSRGLGLVLCRELARAGARLAICARDDEELERARADLVSRGGEVLAMSCDVTSQGQVEHMVHAVHEHYGRIDGLVNNAGIIQVGPLESMTLDDFENAMNTHFWAPLYTTLAVQPFMRVRGEGRIVDVTSIGGKVSVPHLLPYCASKFAHVGLSQGLRAELAKDGIRVTTVVPGLMRTGSPRNATFKGQHRKEFAWFSIGDSLPLLSMDAERAARRIIAAMRRGEAEVTLSLPAKVGEKFHALFPGVTSDLLGLVHRALPKDGGIERQGATGKESTSALSPSGLTRMGDRAAERNNEVDPREVH